MTPNRIREAGRLAESAAIASCEALAGAVSDANRAGPAPVPRNDAGEY